MAEETTPKQTKDEAYAQLRYMQNAYTQQYEIIEEQIATYSLSLDSIRKSLDFLKNSGSVEGKKTLVSLGGGIYTDAQLGKMSKMLVYVGSGYLVEKSASDSSAFIEEFQNKQQDVLKRLDNEKRKLQGELMSIAYKMEAMQQE